jgi:hypothetical protein
MTVQGGLGAPLAFGLLLGGIGTMFGFFWQFLMVSGSLLTVTGDLVGPVGIGAIFIGLMVLSPLYVLAGMFLSAGILHLCLLAVRGGCNGFEGTFRVVAYSQATQVISLIPFVGGLGAWIWNLVVQIVGLKEIHEITYGRVVLALLIPVAVLCLLGLAGVILALVLAS